jgi:putative PIN family toxin of toxin-antitoxin system
MLVVLDTNVLISAFINPAGPPAAILRMTLENRLKLCHNPFILAEYEAVSARPKFAKFIDLNLVRSFIDLLRKTGVPFMPAPGILKMPDEADRIFYDTAKGSGAVLVTGNIRHFPAEPFIMTPADFLKTYG